MELLELVRNCEGSGDVDFLREGVRVLAQALMDAEVSEQICAGHGERAPERRSAQWSGSYYPSILQARTRAEKALCRVVAQCYVEGVSTRRVDDIARAMGIDGISKSQVSRICAELDEVVEAWRNRPLDNSACRSAVLRSIDAHTPDG
jgi:transposase-like protein